MTTIKQVLAGLGKNEKRYLSRRCCWLCDMPLNRFDCSGIYEICSEETRIARLRNCLAKYKPRKVQP